MPSILRSIERNFQRNFNLISSPVSVFIYLFIFSENFSRVSDLRVGRNTNTLRIPVFLEQFIYALRLFIYPSIRFKDGDTVIKIIIFVCVLRLPWQQIQELSTQRYRFLSFDRYSSLLYSCPAPKDTSRRGELEQRIKRTVPDTDSTLEKKEKEKRKEKGIRMYVLTLITACVNERFKMHFCERDRAWGIPRRRERERQLDSWQQCEVNNSTFKINRHALIDAPTFARRFSPLSFHRNQPAPKQCTCPRCFTKVARARARIHRYTFFVG